MSRPNILLLVVDCLRADHVYQPGLAHTPTLDAMRAGGFSFLNTITTNTQTTPAFGCLLTAKYPFETGIRSLYGHRLAEGVRTLPEMLRAAGYRTVAEVSGPLAEEAGLNRGFDEYRFRSKKVTLYGEWGDALLAKFRATPPAPWFMLLHLWEVHLKRRVLPECDNDRCGKTSYARAVSSLDLYLGRLLQALPQNTVVALTGDHGEMITQSARERKWKKARKRLYMFLHKHHLTSRHPAHALRGCWEGHGHMLYDELIKVPLVLHGPGVIPHGASEKQVRHVDIPATILELGGAAPAAGLTGRSLMEMVRGAPGEHRDAYTEVAGAQYFNKDLALAALRTENRYKYIYAPFNNRFKPELFDLAADPGERRDIARSSPDIAARLRGALDAMAVERMPGMEMTDAEKAAALERLKSLGYHDV